MIVGSAVVVVTEFSSFVWLFPSQNMQIYIVKAVEWKTKVKKNIEVQQLCTSSTSPLIDIIIHNSILPDRELNQRKSKHRPESKHRLDIAH